MRISLRSLPTWAQDTGLLALVQVLVWWPLLSGQAQMKWDLTAFWLPWKFFITESLKAGHWPLWNAYTNLGFPQMGDPGTWYPVSWLLGLFRPYDLTSAHIEFVLHGWLAGAGMYWLARTLGRSRVAALLAGTAYMLSGFFVSNAQHLGWLVSAAWLPWVAVAFVRTRRSRSLTPAIALGGALFLLLSGGYPGLFFCGVYLLVAWGLWYLGGIVLRREWPALRGWLLRLAVAGGVFLACSAVVLAASFELAPHLVRGGGLRFDNQSWGVLNGSFPPIALISALFPFATAVQDLNRWVEDFSLLNIYIGIIPLLLALWAGFRRKTPLQTRLWLVVAVLAMLTAMAHQFPLRRWLYDLLPLMNQFRFPAIFRVFAIFGFSLLAAAGLDELRNISIPSKKFIAGLFIIAGLAFGVLALVHLREISALLYASSLAETPLRGRIGLQAGLQSLLLLAAGGWWWLRPRHGVAGLLIITCLDLGLAARLNFSATVADRVAAAPTNATLQLLSGGFPLPLCDRPIGQLNEGNLQGAIPHLTANMGTLYRLPGSDGGSPYALKMADSARKNHDLEQILALSLASVIPHQSRVPAPNLVRPLSATPNRFVFEVAENPGGTFVFAQHAYPGWQAFVDGQPTPITHFATAYQAVTLEAGSHTVLFEFNPTWLFPFIWISIFSWIFVVVWIFWEKMSHFPWPLRAMGIAMLGLLISLGAAMAAKGSATRAKAKRTAPAAFTNPDLFTIWNTQNVEKYSQIEITLPFILRSDIPHLISQTDPLPGSIQLVQSTPLFSIQRDLLLAERPFLSRDTLLDGYTVLALHRQPVPGARAAARLLGFCTYDSASANWQPSAAVREPFGYRLSSGQQLPPDGFSPGLDQPIGTLLPQLTGGRLVLTAKAKPATGPGPQLVIVIKRGDSTLHWFGQPVSSALPTDSSGWYHGHLSVPLPPGLLPSDRLQCYLWNNSPAPATIDDIRLLWME